MRLWSLAGPLFPGKSAAWERFSALLVRTVPPTAARTVNMAPHELDSLSSNGFHLATRQSGRRNHRRAEVNMGVWR